MPIRRIVMLVVALVAVLGAVAWFSQMQHATPPASEGAPAVPAPEAGGASMPPAPATGAPQGGTEVAPPETTSPGLAWKAPANWSVEPGRPMRVATYGIPALAGDAEGAECAVFYFGPTQGGDAEDNMDRWVGQFDHPEQPQRTQAEVAGFKVWRLRVGGDYLAPSGPAMESSGTKRGWELLGAIVEGPAGRVFFKLTGPKKTVDGSRREFDDLLRTLKKD
jgi:hypothetical protein